MRAKYGKFLNPVLEDPKSPSNPSFMFRSIMKAKAIVARGMVWQVGDGSKINFWNDPWVYFLGVYKPLKHWMEAQDIPIVTVQDAILAGGDSRGEFLGGKVSRVKATSPGEAEALAAEPRRNYAVQRTLER
ncbi:hypothetical protein IFM89_020555, partial [Coptis chinensis]